MARPTPAAFDIEFRTNAAGVLEDLKRIDPKLKTGYRRAMREAGGAIINEQKKILASEKGGSVTRTRYRMRPGGAARRGGYRRGPLAALMGGAVIDSVEARESSRDRGRGTRATIASGLTMRVTTPKSGAKARVVTTKGEIRKAMNTKKFRHPVFLTGQFAEQAGTQYFRRGVELGASQAREDLLRVLRDATAVVRRNPPVK